MKVPAMRVNKSPRSPEWDASICESTLEPHKKDWEQIRGSGLVTQGRTPPKLVADAIYVCEIFCQPPPKWLVAAAAENAEREMSDEAKQKRREMRVNYLRWSLVRHFKKRMTWDEAYTAASERLKGTSEAVGEDAVKKSYLKVQKAYKTDHGLFQDFMGASLSKRFHRWQVG
jgi:hypothetical protein